MINQNGRPEAVSWCLCRSAVWGASIWGTEGREFKSPQPDNKSLADRLCRAAPLAVRTTKEVAVRTRSMPWTEAVRFGETMRLVAASTDDANEGRQARTDRRPPEWQAR